MQIAEEADEAAVFRTMHQHLRLIGLGQRALRADILAGGVDGLEIFAVELDAAIFAGEHGVGLGAGGDDDRLGRQQHVLTGGIAAAQAGGMAVAIDDDFHRRHALGKAHAFLHRLFHFLVVERVGGGFTQGAAIGNRRAAPAVEQLGQIGCAARTGGGVAFVADGVGMGEEFGGDFGVFLRPPRPHRRLAAFGNQGAIAQGEFLDLTHVIGQRLRAAIDGGQSATDHHHRKAQLQIGNRVHLRRPGELQAHQEIRRLPHATGKIARHVDDGGLARAHAERDVVKADLPRIVDGQRGAAAEADPALHGEFGAAFEQDPHQLEVVLIPPHGDAVFRHAAEAGQHAVIEVLEQRLRITDRFTRIKAQRFDLQAIDGNHRVAVIHQVMCERVARRAEPHHEHLAPGIGQRQRAADVQRVPAGEQRVDFKAIGQGQHVLEHRGFGLRNIHRLLLLIDAGLHAVIADAVAGGGHHRVVDGDGGEGAEQAALGTQRVHLGDLLVQRAAGEGDTEGRFLELPGLAVAQTLRAAVFALGVAPDAVIDLIECGLGVHAQIGECEAVTMAPFALR